MKHAVLICLVFVYLVSADVYIHGMRGSNNRLDESSTPRANPDRLFDSQNNNNGGYNKGTVGTMVYYTGSKVMMTYTNQHACGDNPNDHCNLVLQYTCGSTLRDGTTTDTPDPDTDDVTTGLHEVQQYYQNCRSRARNAGLFTADQVLRGNTAIYTRQNPNGNRRGLECPEERDYYPYWHPSPWRDIAILTSNTSRCAYYQAESQNVKPKNFCSVNTANTEATCTAAGGTWSTSPAWGIDAPFCGQAMWSRDNHLGNGHLPFENSFNWTIPSYSPLFDTQQQCVFRLRYNISTGDYPWELNATYNGNKSPVRQNPTVDFGIQHGLKLAINTAQYGRTFQDRTHIFNIAPVPTALAGKTIYNINVRGKRGNIVQVYPAVEYDFVPTYLTVNTGDYVHFQWIGSDNNPRGNDGQGTAGTDRSNVVQMFSMRDNFPMNVFNQTLFPTAATAALMAKVGGSDPLLNNAPMYFNSVPVQMNVPGTYYYMCTRNNNFSNRSQKGMITVKTAA